MAYQVFAYPGETFDLGIQSYDELGRPVAAAIRFSDNSKVNKETVSLRLHVYVVCVRVYGQMGECASRCVGGCATCMMYMCAGEYACVCV